MVDRNPAEWDGKTKGSLWGYRFFIGLLQLFGVSVAYIFAGFIIIYYIIFSPKTTKVVFRYFRKRHQFKLGRSFIMTYLNYYRFAQILIDKIAIPAQLAKGFTYYYENSDQAMSTFEGNSASILISAHVGNWDVAGVFFGEHGPQIHIVMLDAEHRRIKNLLESMTKEKNYHIIPVRNDMGHIFEIGQALMNNEHVCFQGDRYIPGGATLSQVLLGAPAVFPAGPFQIAARNRIPVVFFFAMREPHRKYRFFFHQAVIDPSLSRNQLAGSLASQYVRTLESILHRYPEQWFNFYDFWKTNPSNEPG